MGKLTRWHLLGYIAISILIVVGIGCISYYQDPVAYYYGHDLRWPMFYSIGLTIFFILLGIIVFTKISDVPKVIEPIKEIRYGKKHGKGKGKQ